VDRCKLGINFSFFLQRRTGAKKKLQKLLFPHFFFSSKGGQAQKKPGGKKNSHRASSQGGRVLLGQRLHSSLHPPGIYCLDKIKDFESQLKFPLRFFC
jgi:hypothetical protein